MTCKNTGINQVISVIFIIYRSIFIIIEGDLNGRKYLDLLQNYVEPSIQVAAIDQMISFDKVYYQQDGHPAHVARYVTDYLDRTFPHKWIGRNGPIMWPPRSPDLTPLDFFLWGYVKDEVFRTSPGNLQVLKDRITETCANLSGVIIQQSLDSFEARLFHCMEQGGHKFEHLL